MNSISEMLQKTIKSMEGIYNATEIVGNMPHFPALIFSNINKEDYFAPIYEKTESIWMQAYNTIAYTAYQVTETGCQWTDIRTGQACSEDEFRNRLDRIKRNDRAFTEMSQWCCYNLIDTCQMKTLEDFKQCYMAIDQIKTTVVDEVRSLAIVLLDDSISSRALAKEIRDYICDLRMENQMPYHGTVVMATRGIRDNTVDISELMTLAAGLIIISNNDAIGSHDDEGYRNIVTALYSNKINTIAYAFKDRPNRDIALQIYDVLLQAIDRLLKNVGMQEERIDWQKKLGIYGGKISCIHEYLSKQNVTFDLSPIKHLPLKSIQNFDPNTITSMPYAQCASMMWEDSLESFIKDNVYNDANVSGLINTCIDLYEEYLIENVSAHEMAQLREHELDELFSQAGVTTINRNKPVAAYVKDMLMHSLQTDTIAKLAKSKINEMIASSKQLRLVIADLINEFNRLLPADRFATLGDLYKIMAENYLNTDNGKKHLKKIVSPNSTYQNCLNELYLMCQEIIDNNKDIFELPFIKEWEARINNAAANVYTILSQIINQQLESRVYLHGNFPSTVGLSTYMFRTHTVSGGSMYPSDLLRHFESTLTRDNKVHFFNTGSDSNLEVIRLIDLQGSNLKF